MKRVKTQYLAVKTEDEPNSQYLSSFRVILMLFDIYPIFFLYNKSIKKEKDMGTGRIIFIIGAVLILISMLMPWLEIKEASVKMLGYETDGVIVGIIGVAALVIGIVYKNQKSGKPYFLWGIFGALVALGMLINMLRNMMRVFIDMFTISNALDVFANAIGWGLYIAGLGSFLLLIGSIIPTPKTENEMEKISESPNDQNKK